MKKYFLTGIKDKLKNIFKFVFKKKFWQAIFCITVSLFLIFAPSVIFNKKNYNIQLNTFFVNEGDKSVISLWHVETFEGGSASRTKFLEKQAIGFNKIYQNCFFSIKTMTEEQLFYNLNQGLRANIYSFGIGAGYLLKSKLIKLHFNANIRDDLIDYGTISKDIFAYPYILSGYARISRNTGLESDGTLSQKLKNTISNKQEVKSIGFGTYGAVNPSRVLVENSATNLDSNSFFACTSTYNAYSCFLAEKFLNLIGTARDVARCKNREQNGNLEICEYQYLGKFSDLVQYIGVDKNTNAKVQDYCIKFANYLTESYVQSALKNYGLFSINGQSIYENGYMRDFEQALSGHLLSVNVFCDMAQIEEQKKFYFNQLFSKE